MEHFLRGTHSFVLLGNTTAFNCRCHHTEKHTIIEFYVDTHRVMHRAIFQCQQKGKGFIFHPPPPPPSPGKEGGSGSRHFLTLGLGFWNGRS